MKGTMQETLNRKVALAGLCATVVALLGVSGAQAASLVPKHSAYFPGEDIVLAFQGGPGNAKDWVGIYPEGVVPGSVGSTRWQYVDGTTQGTRGVREGQLTFAGGLNLAGVWDAHLLLNDGYTILASAQFRIVEPWATVIRTDKRTYVTGEAITVTFTNTPGNPKDWIGIYRAGQTPGGPASTLWRYLDGTTSGNTGVTDGALTFRSGLAATGDYVAYLLENDGYTILASETFTVVEAAAAIPRLLSVNPPNGAANQPPVIRYAAAITNGVSKVAPASVALRLNGSPVTHQFSEQNGLVTISYTNPDLFAPGSTQTYELRFADDATPANQFTNTVTVTVANYRNIVLPAPIYFEDFDATPEGQLPAGWTQVSFTEILNPDEDFENLDSATYARWTVINADRFRGSFVTYSNPDNPDTWETDYQRVLSVNPLNVVNGRVYDQPLASGRFAFGNSGYRRGASQVLYLFSPDFDLTGRTNVHLAFHSLWEQNQDSIAAIEYSVNQGQTWLPVAYFLDGPDVLTTTNEVTGEVTVDAIATFTTERGDIARYTDPDTGEEKGGSYGAFIAAPLSQDLAPFIQRRVNDNPVESKRVELFRLPAADNQPKVRLRFAHAGTDSWYFGLDNVGLYSISDAPSGDLRITSIVRNGSEVVISWVGAPGVKLQKTTSLTNPNWQDVPGSTGASSVTEPTTGPAAYYRLVR
jgi:hypothetical protein